MNQYDHLEEIAKENYRNIEKLSPRPDRYYEAIKTALDLLIEIRELAKKDAE